MNNTTLDDLIDLLKQWTPEELYSSLDLDNLDDDAYLLLTRSLYDYDDDIVPTSMIKAYVEEIEQEREEYIR